MDYNRKAKNTSTGISDAFLINYTACQSLKQLVQNMIGPGYIHRLFANEYLSCTLANSGSRFLDNLSIGSPVIALINQMCKTHASAYGNGVSTMVFLLCEIFAQTFATLQDGEKLQIVVGAIHRALPLIGALLDEKKIAVVTDGEVDLGLLFKVLYSHMNTRFDSFRSREIAQNTIAAYMNMYKKSASPDINMIEIIKIKGNDEKTEFINGLVLDHGGRHRDMPKSLKNVFTLATSVSFEYEQTELPATFFFKTAKEREDAAIEERRHTDDRVARVVALKNEMCKNGETMILVTTRGIDLIALEMFAKAGILALRRAKRRNLERLVNNFGGKIVGSLDVLCEDAVGRCEEAREIAIGEEKYTYMKGDKRCMAGCIVISNPSDTVMEVVENSLREAVDFVHTCVQNGFVLPGAGSVYYHIYRRLADESEHDEKYSAGFLALAKAFVGIVKVLASNSEMKPGRVLSEMKKSYAPEKNIGIDTQGSDIVSESTDVYDSFCVVSSVVSNALRSAANLMSIDGIIRAGRPIRDENRG